MPVTKQWCRSGCAERKWSADVDKTYRIPLTLSDRLKAERDRLDEQIRVVEAVEQGKEWQFEPSSAPGAWTHPDDMKLESCINLGIRIRIRPTPSSIPWTLETRPLTEVWVKSNRRGMVNEYHIDQWKSEGVHIAGCGDVSYEQLHSDWIQRNGEPAGEKVTV